MLEGSKYTHTHTRFLLLQFSETLQNHHSLESEAFNVGGRLPVVRNLDYIVQNTPTYDLDCSSKIILYCTHKSVGILTWNKISLDGGGDVKKEQAGERGDWSGGTLKWEEEDEVVEVQREIWRWQLTCRSGRWKYKIRLRWKKAGGGREEPTHLYDRRRTKTCDEEEE